MKILICISILFYVILSTTNKNQSNQEVNQIPNLIPTEIEGHEESVNNFNNPIPRKFTRQPSFKSDLSEIKKIKQTEEIPKQMHHLERSVNNLNLSYDSSSPPKLMRTHAKNVEHKEKINPSTKTKDHTTNRFLYNSKRSQFTNKKDELKSDSQKNKAQSPEVNSLSFNAPFNTNHSFDMTNQNKLQHNFNPLFPNSPFQIPRENNIEQNANLYSSFSTAQFYRNSSDKPRNPNKNKFQQNMNPFVVNSAFHNPQNHQSEKDEKNIQQQFNSFSLNSPFHPNSPFQSSKNDNNIQKHFNSLSLNGENEFQQNFNPLFPNTPFHIPLNHQSAKHINTKQQNSLFQTPIIHRSASAQFTNTPAFKFKSEKTTKDNYHNSFSHLIHETTEEKKTKRENMENDSFFNAEADNLDTWYQTEESSTNSSSPQHQSPFHQSPIKKEHSSNTLFSPVHNVFFEHSPPHHNVNFEQFPQHNVHFGNGLMFQNPQNENIGGNALSMTMPLFPPVNLQQQNNVFPPGNFADIVDNYQIKTFKIRDDDDDDDIFDEDNFFKKLKRAQTAPIYIPKVPKTKEEKEIQEKKKNVVS